MADTSEKNNVSMNGGTTGVADPEDKAADHRKSNDDTVRVTNTAGTTPSPKLASVFDVFDQLKGSSKQVGSILNRSDSGTTPTNGQHQRMVSWGQNSEFQVPANEINSKGSLSQSWRQNFLNGASGSLHQPNLSDISQVDGNLSEPEEKKAEGGGSRMEGSLPSFLPDPKRTIQGKVELEDLHNTHPFESEAEKYILKAIMRREASGSQPYGGGEPLTNVSDEAVSNLSPVSSNVADEDQALVSEPSLLDQQTESSGRSRTPRHRRNETLEDKLYGLNSAMDAMHILHRRDVPANDPIQMRVRANTTDSQITGDSLVPGEENLSAGHALERNVGLLYRRRNDKSTRHLDVDDSPLGNSNGSNASAIHRWQHLKHAVNGGQVNAKKDDSIIAEEMDLDDEELGGNASTSKIDESVDPQQPHHGSESQHNFPWYQRKVGLDFKVYKEFQEFFSPRKKDIFKFLRSIATLVVVPSLAVAAVLFHVAGNPPTGILINRGRPNELGELLNKSGIAVDHAVASASWWLLFLGVRQVITFVLAKATEFVVIDFFSVKSKISVTLVGPWATLFILQSKGWPFVLFMWGVFDFALLSGTKPFFSHWAYWQGTFDLLNESNPSGGIVDSEWNRRVISIAVSVGALVAFKRFWLGLFLGRQTYEQFSEELASLMNKVLVISEVASLSKELSRSTISRDRAIASIGGERLGGLLASMQQDDSNSEAQPYSQSGVSVSADDDVTNIIDPDDRHPLTGSLSSHQRDRMNQLLGAWEEPQVSSEFRDRISVSAILQFRRALAFLRTDFPFSGSFGLANTREDMVESCQEVFDRLKSGKAENEPLEFETIAVLGVKPGGGLDQSKLKDLIRLFRPDRDGKLHLIDFVKAVDSVYRELRLLRAAVSSSGKIDHAFENIFNLVFYTVVITLMLSFLGLDPMALFLSFSGVVVAFAFMISSASSKYFEGLLFILVRRPYAVGHGIHISNVEVDTSATGSPWWLVEDVTLFTTTVVSLFTGERATLSNGSLANSRIINASRSPPAWLYILLKFPVDVSYDKLKVFHSASEQFVRNRPREYLQFNSFRATRVEADQGFIEYIVVVQHRDSWDRWGVLQLSKADLASFCLELSKKLHIQYKSPRLPVDLTVVGGGDGTPGTPRGVGGMPGSTLSPGSNFEAPDLSNLQARFAPSK